MNSLREKRKKILFVLVMEESVPSQDFSLKDLPGSSKIDVVSRTILSIFPQYSSRLEPELHVVFTKSSHILIIKDLVQRKLPYDEIEIAALIKESLNDFFAEQKQINKNSFLFWQSISDFETYIKKTIANHPTCYYLYEKGIPIDKYLVELKNDNSYCFILGGRQDISDDHEKIILTQKVGLISLGEKSYLASTCVTAVIFQLENFLTQ